MNAATERLPHIDEHSMVVEASREATWEALQRVVEASVSSGAAPVYKGLVIGTRMHVLVTRRLLGGCKRRAERL
ncbi:MAG TPA: hypothetical protein VKG03_03755 [Solirubrobacterales bacterium]|nr:hypothetical protein [Solirubrobacterales bacterium]